MKKKIFICCTEQSGENICYNILSKLNLKNYNIDGVCGKRSEIYFRDKYFDISDFKSIGLVEVLISIPKYLKMINFLKKEIIKNDYDLIICIDSPDFNYNLVKSLRKEKYNKKILQIVAPSVWAWRESRANKFSKLFDEIFLLFEFEKKFFTYSNIKTTFIGHPIFHIKKRIVKNSFKFISFLPGSRENEIKKLFKYFDEIENFLHLNYPNWKIFIPTLPHLKEIIKQRTANWNIETLVSDDINKFDSLYDDVFISVTCSGTASLEIAKRNIPQIIIYKLNYFTEIIGKLLVKVKYACILNIVSNKMIIPELVNSKLNKDELITNFKKLIEDDSYRSIQINNINNYLHLIENNESPYDISAKRISDLI